MRLLVTVTTLILVIVNTVWIYLDKPSWSAWGWLVVAAVSLAVGGYATVYDREDG